MQRLYGRVYIFIKDLFHFIFQGPGEQLIKKGQKHLRSKQTKPDPDSFTQIHHQSSHTHHLSSKYINKTPNHSVTYSPNHITSSPRHLKASPHHIKYSTNHLYSLPPKISSSAFRQNSLSRQLNTSQFHVNFAPLDDKVSPIRPNITYNKAFQFREENYYKLIFFSLKKDILNLIYRVCRRSFN